VLALTASLLTVKPVSPVRVLAVMQGERSSRPPMPAAIRTVRALLPRMNGSTPGMRPPMPRMDASTPGMNTGTSTSMSFTAPSSFVSIASEPRRPIKPMR